MTYFSDPNNKWRDAELREEAQHFQGERYEEGTPVQFRVYPADEQYIEVILPDGLMLTMLPTAVKEESHA